MKKRNLVRLIVSSALALLLATTALAAPPQSQLETRTTALAALAKRYLQLDPVSQQALLEPLVKSATERRQLLSETVAENPGAVLLTALPAALVESLQPQVQAQLEKRTELEGELEVLYEDYEDHHVLRHVLKRGGERIALHFEHAPKGLQSGTKVRARGVLINGGPKKSMAIDSGEEDLLLLAAGGEGSGSSLEGGGPAPLSNTTGEQSTLVLLVNFQDLPDQPWTAAQLQNLVFGEINNYYQENSFGQIWLGGNVPGWFTLPINTTTDTTAIANAADAAAASAGINIAAYERLVYVFPKVAGLGWSGLGTVGGSPSRSWINGAVNMRVIAHEMGHNLGLYHAHGLECGDVTIGESCSTSPYGDSLDVMGSREAHLNSFHKLRLGWLDPAEVVTIQGGGSFLLEPFEQNSSGVNRVLRVLKETDPVSGDNTWFYLEYRQPIGFDSFLAGDTNVTNGIVIRTAADTNPDSSFLLDMTPGSSVYYDWNDPALVMGNSFTDPGTGLTISAVSGNGSESWVNVAFSSPSCVQAAPSLAVSPSQSQWAAPGDTVSYSVTVTNNDSPACGPSTFLLSDIAPAGWPSGFSNTSVALEPGASTATVLDVISPLSASAGYYDIDVMAVNSDSPAHASSIVLTYVVEAWSSNQPPVVVDDAAATTEGTPVTIDVLANDHDPDGDPLTILSVNSVRATVNPDGTISYEPKRRFAGIDVFEYNVSDGTDTATAEVAVTVSKQSGGSTKGGGGGGKNGGGGKGKKS